MIDVVQLNDRSTTKEREKNCVVKITIRLRHYTKTITDIVTVEMLHKARLAYKINTNSQAAYVVSTSVPVFRESTIHKNTN